jgi:hypothetical protein
MCVLQGRAPWQASKKSIFRIIDSNAGRRIPGEHTGKLGCPFKSTVNGKGERKFSLRKMQSSDWFHLAGPIGVYFIEMTDLHPRYKKIFQDVLWCFHGMRYHSLGILDLQSPAPKPGQKKEYDVLTMYQECAVVMEYLMPINYNHINQHVWQHAVSELIYAGPIFGHHMFPFEAGAGWLKGMLHSPKSPDEGLARAIADEWRTMLHKYDDEDEATIIERLLAPKYRGQSLTAKPVVQYLDNAYRMPQPRPKDSDDLKERINAYNVAELKLLHNYFLENDDVCKFVQDEFKREHTHGANVNEWKKFDIRVWQVSDESYERIKARSGNMNITRSVVDSVKEGPALDQVFVYKKIQINDTVFCDVQTDGTYATTNCCVRYTVNNKKNAWTYAQIERIYRVIPHRLSNAPVTLFRLINYGRPVSYAPSDVESSRLVPLERMSDNDVIGSEDHLFFVPIEPSCVVDDENFAFWPNEEGEGQDEFFAVSYNTLKLEPDSLGTYTNLDK